MSAHVAEAKHGRTPLFAEDLPDSMTALIMVHNGRWSALALDGVPEAAARTTTHAVARLAYAVTRPLPEPTLWEIEACVRADCAGMLGTPLGGDAGDRTKPLDEPLLVAPLWPGAAAARQATEAENERAKLAQQIGERFIRSVEQSSGHQPTNEELRQTMRDAGLLP